MLLPWLCLGPALHGRAIRRFEMECASYPSRVFAVCFLCLCRVLAAPLQCLCRVFAMFLPCLCRVFPVSLPFLCRVFVATLPCWCHIRIFAVFLPWTCSREAAVLPPCVGCGSALLWVVNCSSRACVRVCLGCAVRWPCSRNVLAVRIPTNPARSASRVGHVLLWMGLSHSICSGQALRANPRDAAKPSPEATPCDVARA